MAIPSAGLTFLELVIVGLKKVFALLFVVSAYGDGFCIVIIDGRNLAILLLTKTDQLPLGLCCGGLNHN